MRTSLIFAPRAAISEQSSLCRFSVPLSRIGQVIAASSEQAEPETNPELAIMKVTAEPDAKTLEPGRWSAILAVAQERLAVLAERLDVAFGRIRDQVLKSEPKASHGALRVPVPDLGEGGMARVRDSEPSNARLAADLQPPPRPVPQPDEPRAREIQRQIEAGRKAETYDRERMRDLSRQHHELRGAALDVSPAPKRLPSEAKSPAAMTERAELRRRSAEIAGSAELRQVLERYGSRDRGREPDGRG